MYNYIICNIKCIQMIYEVQQKLYYLNIIYFLPDIEYLLLRIIFYDMYTIYDFNAIILVNKMFSLINWVIKKISGI